MAGCKKVEIMTQKTRFGEASVNGVKLYDYATVKELLTNSVAHQLMPLADFIKTGNGVSYLQTTLRNIYRYCRNTHANFRKRVASSDRENKFLQI